MLPLGAVAGKKRVAGAEPTHFGVRKPSGFWNRLDFLRGDDPSRGESTLIGEGNGAASERIRSRRPARAEPEPRPSSPSGRGRPVTRLCPRGAARTRSRCRGGCRSAPAQGDAGSSLPGRAVRRGENADPARRGECAAVRPRLRTRSGNVPTGTVIPVSRRRAAVLQRFEALERALPAGLQHTCPFSVLGPDTSLAGV